MVSSEVLTICLVIHNEEALLPRCLKSVRKISKNIFIVHDGVCSDKSLEICRDFGCKVVVRPYDGVAEMHRVWQYSQVKTKWILQIDADEFLSTKFTEHIESLLSQDANGYTCIWPYWDGKKYRSHRWPQKIVLFKTNETKLIGAPHEGPRVNPPVAYTPFVLEHRPVYDNLAILTFRTKWVKWAKLHAEYYIGRRKLISFGYKKNESAAMHYQQIMEYPLIALFFLPFYHFAGCIWYGAWKEGYIGFKSSVMMSLYYAIVAYYILIYEYSKTT